MANGTAQPKGSGFVNLRKYLQANTGAGERLGGAIRSGLKQDVGSLRTDVRQAGQSFQTGLGKEQQRLSGAQQTGQQLVQTAKSQPTQIGEPQVQEAKGLLNLQYGGPRGLERAGDLTRRSENLRSLGELTGQRAGRGELLKTYIAPRDNRYTRNLQALDEVLLSQGTKQDLGTTEARRESGRLGQELRGSLQQTGEQAREAGKGFEQFRQGFGQNIAQSREGIQQQVGQRFQQAQTAEQQRQELLNTVKFGSPEQRAQALSQLASEQVTPGIQNLIQQTGAGQYQGLGLQNIPQYLTSEDVQNLTEAGVATPQELASIYALQRLGQDPTAQLIQDTEYRAGQDMFGTQKLIKDVQTSELNNPQRSIDIASGFTIQGSDPNNPSVPIIQGGVFRSASDLSPMQIRDSINQAYKNLQQTGNPRLETPYGLVDLSTISNKRFGSPEWYQAVESYVSGANQQLNNYLNSIGQ